MNKLSPKISHFGKHNVFYDSIINTELKAENVFTQYLYKYQF